jgi:hypothetical protein
MYWLGRLFEICTIRVSVRTGRHTVMDMTYELHDMTYDTNTKSLNVYSVRLR